MSVIGEYTEDLPAEFQKPQYQWWRKALARNRLPIQDGEPRCGLYRWGNRAVAIWQTGTDGPVGKPRSKVIETHIAINGVEVFLEKELENWPYISKEPITPQLYMACRDAGWKWPGGNVVAEKAVQAIGTGHNAPPPDTSPEMLSEQLNELEREAARLIDKGAAKAQAQVDEAARVADAIAAVEKRVIELHRVAKAPHLEAGRKVDATWFPLRGRADELKRRLKLMVITPFLRAEEERLAQESARMIQAGIEPEAITDKTAKAHGGSRTTALRTVTSAEITGYYELLEHLRDHPAIRSAVEDIADRSAKAGVQLPGMKIIKTRSAV